MAIRPQGKHATAKRTVVVVQISYRRRENVTAGPVLGACPVQRSHIDLLARMVLPKRRVWPIDEPAVRDDPLPIE